MAVSFTFHLIFNWLHCWLGGDGGIRTLDRALQPYNGLANRRLQPLGHISAFINQTLSTQSRFRTLEMVPIGSQTIQKRRRRRLHYPPAVPSTSHPLPSAASIALAAASSASRQRCA